VSREWAVGELTESGYPFVVREVIRGRPLAKAREVFRGARTDVNVAPQVWRDGDGHQAAMIERAVSFFEGQHWLLTARGPQRLAMPLKSHIEGLLAGRLLVTLQEDWAVDGRVFPQGALVSVDLNAARKTPEALAPDLVVAPGPRESVEAVAMSGKSLFVVVNQDVKGRIFIYRPTPAGGWRGTRLALPDNAALNVVDADSHADRAFISVTGFLTPTSLWFSDAASGKLESVKTIAPKFDSSRDAIDQFDAVSSDGTRIPYFLVHPKAMALNGANPTLLYAYGGFQVSELPAYSPVLGKLWLELGGVYALANIRGGGEFGPKWHEAGLKTHRQIIYDDFAAVAKDMIARGVTSPRRLGIQGGSNGGLLMGVEFTQHPELWNAVDIQVPLLDMLRFEQIAAGPSWVGEYGSVSNPGERAFLARISPYANLRAEVAYPEPLIWTTTKDDRVGPQHARKFAARLEAMGKPYMFYEVIEGGHGAGANLKEKAHTSALEFVYFIRKLMD
jgi:prolyl oligopeptidase